MDLILLVLGVAIVGWVVYLLTTKIPMDPTLRLVIQIIAVVVLALYLLRRLGLPNVL
jgi:hypothetical protein